MKPYAKLTIAFLLTFTSVVLPLFLPINDGSVFLIIFASLFSMFLLRDEKQRKWYLIFGWFFCLLGLGSLIYFRFGKLELNLNFFLRSFLMFTGLFWAIGVVVGYVLTDGIKTKFNTGIKMGLIAMGLSLIVPPIFAAWVKGFILFNVIYFISSFLNGYLSRNQNIYKDFGCFLIPFVFYLAVFLIVDSSVLWTFKLWKFLSILFGLIMLGTISGYYVSKWKNKTSKTIIRQENEN